MFSGWSEASSLQQSTARCLSHGPTHWRMLKKGQYLSICQCHSWSLIWSLQWRRIQGGGHSRGQAGWLVMSGGCFRISRDFFKLQFGGFLGLLKGGCQGLERSLQWSPKHLQSLNLLNSRLRSCPRKRNPKSSRLVLSALYLITTPHRLIAEQC